jgi:phosphoenolpyruvate-protein kinase (PTS system EI component)
MSVSRILKVKQFIKNVNYNEVKKISNEILAEDDSVRIKQILKSYYDKIYSIINS